MRGTVEDELILQQLPILLLTGGRSDDDSDVADVFGANRQLRRDECRNDDGPRQDEADDDQSECTLGFFMNGWINSSNTTGSIGAVKNSAICGQNKREVDDCHIDSATVNEVTRTWGADPSGAGG